MVFLPNFTLSGHRHFSLYAGSTIVEANHVFSQLLSVPETLWG